MKTIWITTISLAAAAAFGATNAPVAVDTHPSGNKFLFVLETSAATSRLDHGGRQAVVDLIYTGIFGQMREGDTFSVWNYNEEVFAGLYPMQLWKPEEMELASSAGLFLKERPYEKKGQYEAALKVVAELIKGVRNVNVFILSDPSVRPARDLLGDKFTREFTEKARKARMAKQPVVTTLVARDGAITNWIVSIGNDSIKLPAMAIPPHPKPVVTVAKAPAAPRMAKAPIIMTGSRGAIPESKPKLGKVLSSSTEVGYVSSLQTNAAAVAKGTNVVPATLPPGPPAKSAPVTTQATEKTVDGSATSVLTIKPMTPPASRNVVASAPPVAAPAKAPTAEKQETHPVSATKASIVPTVPLLAEPEPKVSSATVTDFAPLAEPVKVAARERSSSVSAAEPKLRPALAAGSPVASPTEPLFSPMAMVVIGVLLLLLAGALSVLFWQFWQRPARPTFITQSMERS